MQGSETESNGTAFVARWTDGAFKAAAFAEDKQEGCRASRVMSDAASRHRDLEYPR